MEKKANKVSHVLRTTYTARNNEKQRIGHPNMLPLSQPSNNERKV